MRIVMMGTGPYAVPTFQNLYASPHDVVALFTRPDRIGPGRRQPPVNPMREVAAGHGTPTYDPTDVNSEDAQAALRDLCPDLLIVCDYGQILVPATLAIAPHGGFNLHASLLPKYRGAAPINWAIYNGETATGNTVIHMSATIDAGPCVAQQTIGIGPDETAAELEPRLADAGAALVIQAITAINDAALAPLPQDGQQVTQAPKLKKTDGEVDWTRTAKQIHDQVRALQPWPKTYTHWRRKGGEPLRVILAKVEAEEAQSDSQPGVVVSSDAGQLAIGTGGGVLRLLQIQPSGKKVLTIAEFLRGYPVQAGDRFGGNP